MNGGIDIVDAIVGHLKSIYPNCATKSEIFSKVGIEGCAGEPWLKTALAGREIEECGKRGSSKTYRYKKS